MMHRLVCFLYICWVIEAGPENVSAAFSLPIHLVILEPLQLVLLHSWQEGS